MSLHPSSSQAFGLLAALAGLCAGAPSVAAGGRVGTASSINDSVTGALGGRPFVVSVGDDVRLRETVQTDSSGQAHLLLVDDTDVAMLSRSTMTIEHYAPGSKLMSTPDGTFLVHTGHGTAGEPRFDTSAGTLTPQGTRFWFDVRDGRIKLDVQQGAVKFCPRGKSQAYCVLATPGRKVVGSAGAPAQVIGLAEPTPPAPPIPPAYPTGINDYPTPYYPTTNDAGSVGMWPRGNCARMENCGCRNSGNLKAMGGYGGCGKGFGGWTTNGDGRTTGGGEGYATDKGSGLGGSRKNSGYRWYNPNYSAMTNSYANRSWVRGNPAGDTMRGYSWRGYSWPALQGGGRAGWPFHPASGFEMGGPGFVR
jgi:hypothetical protein